MGAEAHGHRDRLAAGDGQAPLGHDLLDAGAVGQRADLGPERAERVEVEVDDRPDGDPDVVHVELGAGRTARDPLTPDRLQAVLHRTLGVRQRGDGAVLVTYDGHLTHLREGHQPPVRRVLPGDAVVEKHVPRRVDTGDVEVAQSPQVETPPDHRVHAAGQVVLDHGPARLGAVRIGAEDEVADRPVAAGADGEAEASYAVSQRECVHQGPQLFGGPVGVSGHVGPVEVEVDDRLLMSGASGDVLGDRGDEVRAVDQLRHRAERGDEPGRAVVEGVARDHGRADVVVERREVVQLVLPVVPTREHLQHGLVGRDAVRQPLGEEADDLLGDGGQRLDACGAIDAGGESGQRRDLVTDAQQDLGSLGIHRGLVEPAEADAAGQVADRRIARLWDAPQALQQLARPTGQLAGRRGCAAPGTQQGGDEGDLGHRALLGQEDAEDRGLQLWRAVQRVDAVVEEDATQPLAELLGQPTTVGVEALEVGVEVLARAVHPQLGLAVLVDRSGAGQLGQVGEDLE